MKVRIINPQDAMSDDVTVVPFQANQLVLIPAHSGARVAKTNYGAWLARKLNQPDKRTMKERRHTGERKAHTRRPKRTNQGWQ